MKLAFDCRYLGMSGIGRAARGMLDSLDFGKDEYFLIGKKEALEDYKDKAKIIEDDNSPYSFKGLKSVAKKVNGVCDALIVPNFLVPSGVKIPVYVVMHDLMFLDVKATTKNAIDRFVKKTLLARSVKTAERIYCVSEFTYKRCLHYYPKFAEKFAVNHVGFAFDVPKDFEPCEEKDNTLVFVGNVKPQKGLKTLIEAFKLLPEGEYKLKIIGDKDNFRTVMSTEELTADGVLYTGKISDERLKEEVARAKFLIQPSFYEGFGLPPLEALCLGTKPIVSDIEVFKEVYAGFDVEYFKVGDPYSLKKAILSADPKPKTDPELIRKRYAFKRMTDVMLKGIKGDKNESKKR